MPLLIALRSWQDCSPAWSVPCSSLAWFMTWMWAWGAKKWSNYPIHPPCIPQAWHIRLVFCTGWVSVPVAVWSVQLFSGWRHTGTSLRERASLIKVQEPCFSVLFQSCENVATSPLI